MKIQYSIHNQISYVLFCKKKYHTIPWIRKVLVSSSRSTAIMPWVLLAWEMFEPWVPIARPIKATGTTNSSWNGAFVFKRVLCQRQKFMTSWTCKKTIFMSKSIWNCIRWWIYTMQWYDADSVTAITKTMEQNHNCMNLT